MMSPILIQRLRRLLPSLLLVAGLSGARASTVVSSLPPTAPPGLPFAVTEAVTPDPGVVIYAVEDTVPPGWTVQHVSDDGTFDPTSGKVQWGPFFDNATRSLSYQITPPGSAIGTGVFSGMGLFDLADQIDITGQRSTTITLTQSNTVSSALPATYTPGMAFAVTNTVSLAPAIRVYAVQDQVPAGWVVTGISDGGVFDGGLGVVKWGPFFDGVPRALFYAIQPPRSATGLANFSGLGIFDGITLAVTGQRQSTPVAAAVSTALSVVPATYTPGQWLVVTNLITPAGGVQVFAVADAPPAGWAVTNISPGGTYDSVQGQVKWGPFFGSGPQVLSYAVLPPADASGVGNFVGTARFDSADVIIGGQRQSLPVPLFFGSAVSSLPTNYQAGVAFGVTNAIVPAGNVTIYAVADVVPAGWAVTNINPEGTFDATTLTVKWGPFFDALPRTLTYQITPPVGATGVVLFSGQAIFNATAVPITGARQTTASPVFAGSVVCSLPANFLPGQVITVTDLATPPASTTVYAVQDTVPPGWTVTNISDAGVFDAVNRTVKWGPFFDAQTRSLTYGAITFAPPANRAMFTGSAYFDSTQVTIGGDRQSLKGAAAPIGPLVIENWLVLVNGAVQFDFRNTNSVGVTVLVATNASQLMTTWAPQGTPTPLGNGQFRFTDAGATNFGQRFYRLRSP